MPKNESVTTKIAEIDTTAVGKLVQIRKKQAELAGFIEKAESLKDKTKEAVYRRVMADYERRRQALADEAVPLKEEARREYRKLRALREEFQQAYEQASMDKEEIEVRHAVGELDDEETASRLEEIEKRLTERKAELDEVEQLRLGFLEAFDSEEELEADAAPPPEPPAPPPPEPPAAEEGPDATLIAPMSSPDKTVVVSPEVLAAAGADEADSEQTVVVPKGTLTWEKEDGTTETFPLGVMTGIGRADENQICLKVSGVSRKHALITVAGSCFSIKDLGSQNGTFVNGKRITECLLSDGDRLRIGKCELTFHQP